MQSRVTCISSREFNQGAAAAKRAARDGPVLITNRGRPSHVLLSYEQYKEIRGPGSRLSDVLSRTPGVGDIDFELPDREHRERPVDLP